MSYGYKPAITGMRGVAALYVLALHLDLIGLASLPIVDFGWSGVEFFFVLSGYLLTKIYQSVDVNYFIRRVFRTFPLYYLTLPLFFIVAGTMGAAMWSPIWLVYLQNYFVSTHGAHSGLCVLRRCFISCSSR